MNRQFAALRGIAMILVVLHHAVDLTKMAAERAGFAPLAGVGAAIVTPFYELGIYAVPLFLFISGAFMAYAAKGTPPAVSWKVVRNALKRLLWPYLLWSAVLYLEVFFHYGEVHSITEYVKKLIIGSPFDFVPLLFFFYFVAPFMVKWAQGRRGLLLVLGIGLVQLVVMNIEAPGILGFHFPGWMPSDVPIIGRTLAQYAVYFPLGLVYSLNAKVVNPVLKRWQRPLLILNLALFALHLLHAYGFIATPIIQYVAAVAAMMVMPLISRTAVPQVRRVEQVSKRSYGLYLIHFTLIDVLLFAISSFAPGLFRVQLLLMPLMFVLGFTIPIFVMERLSQMKQVRPVYQYIFG
ncbi:MAG: acyltransferase [Ardenticatenaceae bacterium]|nr:acyltransferase [Anaerolineales bacterium]MCB8921103.1 acyltransferase [Ardenticatenaceae bacterium]